MVWMTSSVMGYSGLSTVMSRILFDGSASEASVTTVAVGSVKAKTAHSARHVTRENALSFYVKCNILKKVQFGLEKDIF